MVRLERRVRLRAAFALVGVLASSACGDGDKLPLYGDAGTEDAEVPFVDAGEVDAGEADAGPSTEVAPSGAALAPAVTVMSSGNFRLIGTMAMGIADNELGKSPNYSLRGGSFSDRK